MKQDREDLVRKKRRGQKRRKILLSMFLAVLLLIGLAVLLIWKVFTVKEVVVEGNTHYSGQQIEKLVLSDKYSWSSLYVLLKYRFLEVEEVPFVDTMEVSLKDPHTLKVHVYEKAIIGYLYISAIGQNAYFDKDGFVVETSRERIENIPRIEGLACDKVVLYEKLPIEDERVLKNLLAATQALKKNEVVPEKICFDEKKEISLQYGGIEALLGSGGDLTQKIVHVAEILKKISGKTGVLHAENWTGGMEDIIFQENK